MYKQYPFEKYGFSVLKMKLVFDMHLRCNKFDETLYLKCIDFLGDFCYSSCAITLQSDQLRFHLECKVLSKRLHLRFM